MRIIMLRVNNKKTHAINGNPEILNKQINIIQINSSNANFNSKLEELVVTMERQKADVCVISESNMEHSNPVKMTERKSKFPQYNIVDKIISNHDKARVSVLIHKEIKFTRLVDLEDDENPMILIKIKEKQGRNLVIAAIYR